MAYLEYIPKLLTYVRAWRVRSRIASSGGGKVEKNQGNMYIFRTALSFLETLPESHSATLETAQAGRAGPRRRMWSTRSM